MRVAVYCIALNEKQFVDSWFNSAKDADYLLIADTGSSDGTVEYAKSLGINVFSVTVNPWRFDNARNASLALIPPDIDYCIALDMDEVLLPGWREHLEKAFEAGATRPRYQYTWSWVDEERTIPGLQYGGDKIHSRTGYRWKHPVHEVLVTDRIEEKQEWVDLEIHHYPDSSKSRGQYLPLLELAVREDPNDDRNTYYYARELFFNFKLQEAKKEFLRHLSLPTAVWKPERSASMRYVAKCSEGSEREEWFLKAAQEAPNRREPLVDVAKYYYETQQWEKSLKFATKAISIKEKPLEYLCEEEAWGDLPYDLAAIASFNLGKYEDALKFGGMAAEINPNNERLKNNLIFYSSKINN
jgi:glycosyltransferase involved in cell wall biosynthesis